MRFHIDRESSIPIYLQIRNRIRDMIMEGTLQEGFRLPPERKLAQNLEVNRSTVLNAYRELKADGLVDSRVGQGTVVCARRASGIQNKGIMQETLPWRQYFSEGMARSRDTMVRDLMELANREDMISFAAGVAIPGIDSLDALQNIQLRLVKDCKHSILHHTPTEGHYPLRESISRLMKSRQAYVPPEEVVVLSGSQQGLDLTARSLIDPGDVVVVEEPTFFCALQIFNSLGARILGVPVDGDGMRMDMLESLLQRYKPKLVYTMPTFQNPSGVVMSLERRRQLLNLAYKYRVPILEDDPYGELRYEGEALPSLKALDEFGYVIYLSTFSKVMFAGLRIGWAAAPKPFIHQLTILKQLADLHASSMAQWIFDAFLREGLLEPHIQRIRKENMYRRDIMLEELEKYAVPGMEWNRPEGGIYIWCTLPGQINPSRLIARAADRKVAYVPGEVFFPDKQSGNRIRLNFTYPKPELIREGVKRLVSAIEESVEERHYGAGNREMEIRPII